MNIDKRALREVAEKATPGNWRRTSSLFNGITVTPFSLCGEEVMLAHTVEKRDAEFIAAANPATMLALLDENNQLQRGKDAIEAVALVLRDDMRQAREQLAAAEKRNAEQREYYEGVIADGSKRIAELEKGHQEAAKQINSWRRLAKQNIAERGKDISELEAARQRIAELEARTVNLSKLSVGEVMHLSGFSRDYAEGWCAGNDNAMHEIRAAGIKVKGE
ncbi:ead/Ea22-like family protein [Salmonella enterica]